MKLCLVCSSGGHFLQLYYLKELWSECDRFWVTFPTEDTKFFLHEERAYQAYYPTNRNVRNFIRNFFLASKILRKEKPHVIISTGAGVGVPFIYWGRLLGMQTIYIESLARVERLSLSARLVRSVASILLVQWPELTKKYKQAVFKGQIM